MLTARQASLVAALYPEATKYGVEHIDACTDALVRAVVAWDEERELTRLVRLACRQAVSYVRRRPVRITVELSEPVAPAASSFDAVAFIERHLTAKEREALAPREGEHRNSTLDRRNRLVAKLLEALDQ